MNDKKFVKPGQVSDLLNLPEATLKRWIKQGKIPYKTINKQILFELKEITKWAREHDLQINEISDQQTQAPKDPFSLSAAIGRGGIYKNLSGSTAKELFDNALEQLSFLREKDKPQILTELLNREALASTGIGNGIALPHTRNRLELGLKEPHIPLFFLEHPVMFGSVDDKPVYVFFMLFTASVKAHLKMLSGLSYMLQNDAIQNNLAHHNTDGRLITLINRLEK